MILRKIGLDKVVLRGANFSNRLGGNVSYLKNLTSRVLGIESSDWVQMASGKASVRFWAKDYGVDLKIDRNVLLAVEFQSTFFCFSHAFDLIQLMGIAMSEETDNQISLSEIHVAQDFTDLRPEHFFEKGFDSSRYVKKFKCIHTPYTSEDNSKTFYLRANSGDWTLIVYDKKKELIENKSRATEFKNSYYNSLGYFDDEVIRVELKINSKVCRKHFHNFFTLNEAEFCKSVLADYFKGHKIYELKKGENFNEKNPSRNRLYALWKDVFSFDSSALPTPTSELRNEILTIETLDKSRLTSRLSNLFSKYDGELTVDIIEDVLVKAKEKKEQRVQKYRNSILKQQEIFKSSKGQVKDILVRDKETGKIVSNFNLRSFFKIKDD